jgi:predicted amidohydrolase
MEDYVVQIIDEHPDVRLICFGETTLGWYWKPGEAEEYQRRVAEPIDGTTVTLMRELSQLHSVHISFGFAESDNGKIYNSAVIIDDNGEIIAHRRKSHFVIMDLFSGYTIGEKIVTTAYIDGVKAAFLICNDFNSREYQEQINTDPEIKMLVLPHATANLEPDFWENYQYNFKGLWMLSAQRYGEENSRKYYGSWILDPNGYMVAYSETGPGYFYYQIPVD